MRSTIVAAHEAPTADACGFDSCTFSHFKHGAAAAAWQFGTEIADACFAACPDDLRTERLVVAASCYKSLPVASAALAKVVSHLFNQQRLAWGIAPAAQTQLYRDQLIEGDYSSMTLGERQSFIDQDSVTGDTELLAGATVVVVDDLRITGFHESLIGGALAADGVASAIYAYLARIDGRKDPTIERRLNLVGVSTLADLARLVTSQRTQLNSRMSKLILSAPADDVLRFAHEVPTDFLADLVAGIASNGYALMPKYRSNYHLLRTALVARSGGE